MKHLIRNFQLVSLLILYSMNAVSQSEGNPLCLKTFLKDIPSENPVVLKHFQKLTSEKEQKINDNLLSMFLRWEAHRRGPKFVNHKEDIEQSKTWNNGTAPKALQDLLPKDIAFHGHVQNYTEYPGAVKREEPGKFISLRYTGGDNPLLGTSIGSTGAALVDYMGKPVNEKYLVRKDADAVIVWTHGGGTKTTGYQTGSQLTNMFYNYNVDVLSLSLPWHDEGPRHVFKSANEFFDWMNDIIELYVPKGKPVFVMGHSMGGLISEMIMRRTDDPNFKLGQRISGLIPMATVADLAPAGTAREKIDFNRDFEFESHMRELQMSPHDAKIFNQLVTDRKISFLTFIFINIMMFDHNWEIPDHKGKKWKPSLVIAGEKDGLTYVGYEESFNKYLKILENVDFVLIKPEKDAKGELINDAGHVTMLDRKVDSKKNQEYMYFNEILKFLSKHMGKELKKQKGKIPPVTSNIIEFLSVWSNNLIFREYVKGSHPYLQKAPTETLNGLQNGLVFQKYIKIKQPTLEDLKSLEQSVKELHDFITTSSVIQKYEEFAPAKEIIQKTSDLIKKEGLQNFVDHLDKYKELKNNLGFIQKEINTFLRPIRENKYAPKTEEKIDGLPIQLWVEKNIKEMKKIGENYSALQEERKKLTKEREQIDIKIYRKINDLKEKMDIVKEDTQKLNGIIKHVNEIKKSLDSYTPYVQSEIAFREKRSPAKMISDEHIALAKKDHPAYVKTGLKLDDLFQDLFERQKKLREIMDNFLLEAFEKNELSNETIEKTPEELSDEIKEFEKQSAKYAKASKNLLKNLYEEVKQDKLDEYPEIKKLLLDLYGNNSNLDTRKFSKDSLLKQSITLTLDIEKINHMLADIRGDKLKLNKEYVENITSDFFKVSLIHLKNELDEKASISDVKKQALESKLSNWSTFWSDRPKMKTIEALQDKLL